MDTIHKYGIKLLDTFEVAMPDGAQILHVNAQHGAPVMWARVDTEAQMVKRKFRLAGTGHDLAIGRHATYLGTVILSGGMLVFHLFEITGTE